MRRWFKQFFCEHHTHYRGHIPNPYLGKNKCGEPTEAKYLSTHECCNCGYVTQFEDRFFRPGEFSLFSMGHYLRED